MEGPGTYVDEKDLNDSVLGYLLFRYDQADPTGRAV